MKVIIITGASSGIGKEFALQLDRIFQNIDEFWLIARGEENLKNLQAALNHRSIVLPLDITGPFAQREYEELLRLRCPNVCMLINSAGYGISGAFCEQESYESVGMVKLNCEALTKITQLTLPYMVKGGRVINMASAAAFLPQPDFAVYAASKAYVLSFSRALNEELKSKKITVTAVCPGPVDTAFLENAWKGQKVSPLKKRFCVEAKPVVTKAIIDSYHKKPVSTYGIAMKSVQALSKVVPNDFLINGMRILKHS